MKHLIDTHVSTSRHCINIFFVIPIILFLCSCSGNNNPGSKTGSDNKAETTRQEKGKKIDKENNLTKPLSLTESNIAGKVKYISYKRYNVRAWHGTIVKKTVVVKGYFSYDIGGRLLCHNEYQPDGIQLIGCIYSYDNQNRNAEWDITDKAVDRDSKIVFSYDKKGNKTEEIIDDKDPKFSTKAKFKYDGNGNEITEYDYAAGEKLKGFITSKYDERGNQVELAYRAPDRAILKRTTRTYDNSSNEIAGENYDSDTEVIARWECKNNEKGKPVEKTFYAPYGSIVLRNTCKYDDHGNLLECNYYTASGSLNENDGYSFEYVYDKAGNIIKQTKFVTRNGRKVPVELTESEFEYF